MTPNQIIERFIKTAEEQKRNLAYDETVSVLKAITHISEEKTLLNKLIYIIISVKKPSEKEHELTKREIQIFNLIGAGFKSKEIGVILNISTKTVSTHRKNIIKKMKLRGSGHLKNIAYRNIQNKLQSIHH